VTDFLQLITHDTELRSVAILQDDFQATVVIDVADGTVAEVARRLAHSEDRSLDALADSHPALAVERVDLARKYPEKLAALKAQFDADAGRYHVYPFIDWDDVLKRRIHNNVPLKGFAKQ